MANETKTGTDSNVTFDADEITVLRAIIGNMWSIGGATRMLIARIIAERFGPDAKGEAFVRKLGFDGFDESAESAADEEK
jgi:hypothetical protein